jgi:hypothetical protein
MLSREEDGFDRARRQGIDVLGPGPFFEFEGAEALLTAQVTDAAGTVLTRRVRLVLTFVRPDDWPDEVPPTPREPSDPCLPAAAAT